MYQEKLAGQLNEGGKSMTTPNIETKEIGISFGVDKGIYENTEIVGGVLKLKRLKNSDVLYENIGYWESEVLDAVDKFRDYDKLAITKQQFTDDLYKVETRTSDNGVSFNDYIAITVGGSIISPKKRYIQIKITLYVGKVVENEVVSDFSSPTDASNWDSEFINTEIGLQLKTNYSYEMAKDDSWTDEGTLFRQPIQNIKFKRINTLELE